MSVPTQTLIKAILLLLLPTLDVAPCVDDVIYIHYYSVGAVPWRTVVSPATGVDQDVSRMIVKVGVTVGDVVSSLDVVLYDVLKW